MATTEGLATVALTGPARAAQVMVDVGGVEVHADVAGEGTTADTRFLLFSLSKPLTAASVFTLIDAGALTFSTKIASVLPAFGANGKADVTVGQVLTHTAGFPTRLGPLGGGEEMSWEHLPDWERQIALICDMPLDPELVGTPIYHGLSFSILGAVVEAVGGTDFRTYCQKALFDPVGMSRTTFGVPGDALDEVAPMDGPPEMWAEALIPAGNAFGTAADLSRFFLMLRDGGSIDGRRVLSEQVIRDATTPQTAHGGIAFGYGLFVCPEGGHVYQRGTHTSPGTFGHSGAFATQAFHDPVADLTFVGLTSPGQETQAASDARFDVVCDEAYRRFLPAG